MTDRKIYFICRATNTNDTIDSINHLKKQNLFNFSSLPKIKNDDNSKLEEIGVYESYICQNNKKVSDILKLDNKIYCPLDIYSIECASILMSISGDCKIYPLPYMSSEKIQNKKLFDKFKRMFGDYTLNIPNHIEITNMSNYWNNMNDNFSGLKKKNMK